MHLRKFTHACFTVEQDGQALVVDPGGFSDDFVMPDNVVAVVLTHQHPDHTDQTRLSDIVRRYPDVPIFTTADNPLDSHYSISVVANGDTETVGPFTLQFFGGTHAPIDTAIPCIDNVGVLINGALCYPGDSFTIPACDIDTLLLPVAAPWMAIADALDAIRQSRPRQIFPTHDAILSEAGQGVVDRLVGTVAQEHALTYRRLSSGERVEIAPDSSRLPPPPALFV